MTNYNWNPISELPENWQDYTSTELQTIAKIWVEQKQKLKTNVEITKFNERLCREWAIESGIIEGLYTIDRGITELLIEHGISASLLSHGGTNKPTDYVIQLMKDQQSVIEGLFDFVKGERSLSTGYIRELHAALTRNQDGVEAVDSFGNAVKLKLESGEYKKLPNNPRKDDEIHEYCPPEQVASEMERLVHLHMEHQRLGVPPEVQAAWLHHRFTQIHPFQDGNGRVARSLATLVFLRSGWFPLVIVSHLHRNDYIDALERADHGDLSYLIQLFVDIEKRAFLHALSLSEEVSREAEELASLMRAVEQRLHSRSIQQEQQFSKVFDLSSILEKIAEDKLHIVENRINELATGANYDIQASVSRSDMDTDHWFWRQIIETARMQQYYANLHGYKAWVRLSIRDIRTTNVVLAFHAIGSQFVGLMAASPFIEHRQREEEDGEVSIAGPFTLSENVFSFGYNDSEGDVAKRFSSWIDKIILLALAEWQKQL